jgi:hypothetical protein
MESLEERLGKVSRAERTAQLFAAVKQCTCQQAEDHLLLSTPMLVAHISSSTQHSLT